jgi:hypothetical protein
LQVYPVAKIVDSHSLSSDCKQCNGKETKDEDKDVDATRATEKARPDLSGINKRAFSMKTHAEAPLSGIANSATFTLLEQGQLCKRSRMSTLNVIH